MALIVSKNGQVFDNTGNVWAQMNPQNIDSPDAKKKFEQQQRITDQTIETAQVPLSEAAIAGYSQAMRNLPEFQNMVNEDQTNVRMRDAIANLPVPERSGWVAPLAALTDTWTKSKLAGSVPKIQGNAELLMGLQNKVDQDKKKQLDTILSSIDKFKSGSVGTTKGVVRTTDSSVGTGDAAGKAKNLFEEEFAKSGAKAVTKFIDQGGESRYISMADELENIASTLEAKKGNIISPTGMFGAAQSWAASVADPEVAKAMDKIDALSVEISSPDFRGSTSDRDARIMSGGLVSKRGDETEIAESLAKKAATIRHVGRKQQLKFEVQSKGGTSSDVEKALKAADDAFYGPAKKGTEPAAQQSGKAAPRKQGEKPSWAQ